MPRANLRHAKPVVARFCAERAIPYVQCSVIASYTMALEHLLDVGSELRPG
jgi:16S rRNA A1518/A1519 N6-dimethyltransferase RsmA/KsgA/DIM1 with predicted DNA glycosylase/AP lyase activity